MKPPIVRGVFPALLFIATLPTGGPLRAGGGVALAQAPADEEKSSPATAGRVPPLVVARPDELGERSMSGAYRFYLGTTHAHSGYSGDHAKTVATKFNKGVADYGRHTPIEIYE